MTPATILLWGFVVTAVAPCNAQSGGPTGPLVEDLAKVRSLYDRGFERVVRELPPTPPESSSPLRPLWDVAHFRREHVGWAILQGEAYRAAQAVERPLAWLVVVPPESPAFRRMKGPIQLDPTTDILVVQVAPQFVSEAWAGILLVHYLSLLADYARAPAPSGSDDYDWREWRAYQVELRAADALSRGGVRRAIDQVLTDVPVRTSDELFARLDTLYGRARLTAQTAVTVELPLTRDEATLRNGFILTSIIVRFAELRGLSDGEAAPLLQRLGAYLAARRSSTR